MRALVKRGTRAAAVILALIGATALLIAGQSSTWWSAPEVSVSVGPTSSWVCFGDACQRSGLDWIPSSASWARFGVAVWAAALIGAVCLIALAGSVAARKGGGRLPAKMVIAAAVAAIAAAVVTLRGARA